MCHRGAWHQSKSRKPSQQIHYPFALRRCNQYCWKDDRVDRSPSWRSSSPPDRPGCGDVPHSSHAPYRCQAGGTVVVLLLHHKVVIAQAIHQHAGDRGFCTSLVIEGTARKTPGFLGHGLGALVIIGAHPWILRQAPAKKDAKPCPTCRFRSVADELPNVSYALVDYIMLKPWSTDCIPGVSVALRQETLSGVARLERKSSMEVAFMQPLPSFIPMTFTVQLLSKP